MYNILNHTIGNADTSDSSLYASSLNYCVARVNQNIATGEDLLFILCDWLRTQNNNMSPKDQFNNYFNLLFSGNETLQINIKYNFLYVFIFF